MSQIKTDPLFELFFERAIKDIPQEIADNAEALDSLRGVLYPIYAVLPNEMPPRFKFMFASKIIETITKAIIEKFST